MLDGAASAELEAILDLEARGLLFSAHDAAMAALARAPQDWRLAHRAVLTLARSGATDHALALFGTLQLGGAAEPELAALEARLLKDSALTARIEGRPGLLARARASYMAIWKAHGRGYHGINAAALWLLEGDAPAAAALAREVARTYRDAGDFWSAATLAEALLLAGDETGMAHALMEADARPDGDAAMRSSTRRQLRRSLRAMGRETAEEVAILALLPAASTLHFCGHLPGATWDSEGEAGLSAGIERALSLARRGRLEPGAGFGALAAGADILVAEALLRRGLRPQIVLPGTPAAFAARSVLPFGEGWMRRFDACLTGCDLLVIDEASYGVGDGLDLALASRRAMGQAMLRAAHVDGDAVQIALSDGIPPRGPLGTARDVASWEATGAVSHRIAWPWPRPAPPAPDEAEAPPRQLKAVLFADLQHFGKLGDIDLAAFYRGPMAAMGRVVAAHGPDYRNAWGDAVQLVFSEVAQAGHCAFGLRDALTPTLLAASGLPEALVPRIALDFGPLIPVQDAVQGAAKFAGRAMTRAARVEPVTPPGQIHATQAFACEVALSPGCGLVCDYVGQTHTAKGFGIMPLYAVGLAGDVGT